MNGLGETIEVLDKEAANLQAKDLSTDQVERCLPHFAPHEFHISRIVRILIKCRQPAKKPATWRFEPSTFWGNRVKLESESLKLPTALSYQAAYFNILAVYLKN